MYLTTSRQSSLRWHVYGISRRGYGVSGYSPTDNPADRLGEDVMAVIGALRIKKPILVGHSVAGAELSSVANRHPGQIAGLVYLDAAYSYAFHNGNGFDVGELQNLHGPKRPEPVPADFASFSALEDYYVRVQGFRFPEAELRRQWESDAAGRIVRQRELPGAAMVASLIATPAKYTKIPVPALVIFANPHSQGPWAERNSDASVRASAKAYSTALAALTAKQEKSVRDAVPAAHVVELPNADHFVFLSSESDVLREIRDFVAGLN
jgi:non-heme chloroperoxidase